MTLTAQLRQVLDIDQYTQSEEARWYTRLSGRLKQSSLGAYCKEGGTLKSLSSENGETVTLSHTKLLTNFGCYCMAVS